MSPAGAKLIVCGFCAREFPEDRGQPACRGCPLSSGCHFVRCPDCGYENPLPPDWLRRLTRWTERHESD
jgi:hypothetical protein